MSKIATYKNNAELRQVEPNQKLVFRVEARNAIFTDPISRGGGERISYSVPTYSALVGICESVFWKPTIRWRVTRVRILNPIRMETKALKVPRLYTSDKPGEADISFSTYLSDVAYQVEAELCWNEDRPDLIEDRKFSKFMAIAARSVQKGGRMPVFLGKKEGNCYGYVSPCDFGEGSGAYDHSGEICFGNMVHSIIYPEENISLPEGKTGVRMWNARMVDGVIHFPAPQDIPPERIHTARTDVSPTKFPAKGPVESIDVLWKELFGT